MPVALAVFSVFVVVASGSAIIFPTEILSFAGL